MMRQFVRGMAEFRPVSHRKAFGFSWQGMKHHKAVVPLVVLISCTVVGMIGFIVYCSQTRDNLVFRKTSKPHWQTMDLENPRALKIRVVNQEYAAMNELSSVYRDMYSGKEEQKTDEVTADQ
ncbi:normal mucosa of esophagus-specific gene 1 protein-like [Lutzomyia longipalpis]|uniref:normal mucosa of esophagus-specific gene 1 protein-like n=1 Tax=Lutzomyia longipalpis TaxID=7200 RepID=UPI0024837284|nr:normal mucosa of esophagus-specific gene 1 protein-like [Lutzomyia longipalpis]